MPYTKLLNDIIDKSGLSVKEIAEKCTQNGVKVTSSYISTLKNDTNNRAPSDEVSRAIAKACNYPDEGILVLEAYIDNAPPEFEGILNFLKSTAVMTMVSVFENEVDEIQFQMFIEAIKDMPISELLMQFAKADNESIEKIFGMFNVTSTINDELNNISVRTELKEAQGFPVLDNSMFPLMQNGNKVILELKTLSEFFDGDIIAFSTKKESNIIYRKVVFIDDEHTKLVTFPINTEYDTVTYSSDDIIILGKVKQVIADL